MSRAATWVSERCADAPPALRARMLAALAAAGEAAGVADTLAGAALTLIEEVLDGSGGRDDALPLLAADALLTHAFEARAEADPGGVSEFAARWGAAGRLGSLATGGHP